MDNLGIEPLLPDLTDLSERQGVVLAYLFGSQATGHVGPLSDVDIAGLLSAEIPQHQWGDIQLTLTGEVMNLLHRGQIDVVISTARRRFWPIGWRAMETLSSNPTLS